MANFQYTFSDGSSMDIPMPSYTTWTQSNCKHQKTPTPSQQMEKKKIQNQLNKLSNGKNKWHED